MGVGRALSGRGLTVAIIAALCVSCNPYDTMMLPSPDAAAVPSDAGDGNHTVDGGPPTGMAGSAGTSSAGRGGRGGGGAGTAGMSGMDAPIPAECVELLGCSEECPESCNGRDDDCDGDVDEEQANAQCAAANSTSICAGGECLIVECLDGYRDCDREISTGCETAQDDPNHCGACGTVCELENAIAGCSEGQCVAIGCAEGFADCDVQGESCEVELVGLENCGGCGTPCGGLANASPECSTGSCGIEACLGNFGDCDEDPITGCEQALDTLEDCGGCEVPCAKASCAGGVCTAAQCTDPLADCDGDDTGTMVEACETDISNDVSHCGGCNLPCTFTSATPRATLSCASKSCEVACDADYGDCDENYATGCETPLLTTANHCNGCGNNCATMLPHLATGTCAGGTCGVGTCASGWCNYDDVAANGCERNTTTDGPCTPDTNCVKQSYGGHDYFFCTNALTWTAARDKCRLQLRGDLVAITSAGENTFVQNNRSGNMWIGARDAAREGTWRWERNGVPFWLGGVGGTVQSSLYARWSSGQPDDYQANEDCAEVWNADGTWNDLGCGSTRGYVCEIHPDDCPSDASKYEPGQCGCGVVDTDTDGDGFANCAETCDSDAGKQAPGQCGCAVADTDSDGDGTANCNDGCPSDPTQTAACLTFAPTNFDPTPINWSAQPQTTLNCGTTTVNTTDPDGAGALVATITNWCGAVPVPIAQNQTNGPQAVIIPLRSLNLSAGHTLRLIGNRPVIFAVDGAVTIGGVIDADASGTTSGAGGNWSCAGSQGGNGSGSCGDIGDSGGGGGGGGFGTSGGIGGNTDDGNPGGGGAARGNANLVPLVGGCAGGNAGGSNAAGAAGGGAVQISASGTLAITGTVRANGGNGVTPNSCGDGGGTAGGSGGGILLEATSISTGGATIQARGGNGGGGDESGYTIDNAGAGGGGSTAAGNNGGNGGNSGDSGGGGGGGGYGRIRTAVR